MVAVHNLSENPRTPTLEMDGSEELVDLFGDRHYDSLGAGISEVGLEGYGYRWFRVRRSY